MPYYKKAFDVEYLEQAKHVVLTGNDNNKEKFQQETDFLISLIEQHIKIDSNSLVLDFGCGMGRISKELIRKFDCEVYGQDISDTMLQFALIYTSTVNVKKFHAVKHYNRENSIDVALSILVLQHTEDPKKELDRIYKVLKPNGDFILVNENKRFIPVGVDSDRYVIWHDDGFDIKGHADSLFNLTNEVRYLETDKSVFFYKK
jgi:2-polyprenyl-3-methyl-5-hydroxy-6-metoxy-1,4-benzoquinol methylase